MGVVNFFDFLKQYSPKCKKERKIQDLKPGKCGVDALAFLYGLVAYHGKDLPRISSSFLKTLKFLKKHGQTPIVVFDGPMPVPEKEETNINRRAIRNEKVETKNILNKKLKLNLESLAAGTGPLAPDENDSKYVAKVVAEGNYLSEIRKLENTSVKVDETIIKYVMNELQSNGIMCIQSESESDFVLAHLYRSGEVQYVMGDDGDMLVFGVGKLVRNLSKHIYEPEKETLKVYDLDRILKDLKLTQNQLIILAIFAKCDYTKVAVPGIGAAKAYKALLQQKTLKKMLKFYKGKYHKSFPDKAYAARNLFRNPRSTDWRLNLVEKEHEIFRTKSIRMLITSY